MICISSIASPEPQTFRIDDDSNEPTMPYGFGRQFSIVPPNPNDFNLPPNPFNIQATLAKANNTKDANDNNYYLESPEPSEPSPISTPPMNVSAFNGCETSHRTTDDDTFHSSDENRRIYFLPPSPSPPPSPPRKLKIRLSLGMSFSKERGSVAAHLRSLRSDDPLSKGHPRSVKEIKTAVKTIKRTHELQLHHSSIN